MPYRVEFTKGVIIELEDEKVEQIVHAWVKKEFGLTGDIVPVEEKEVEVESVEETETKTELVLPERKRKRAHKAWKPSEIKLVLNQVKLNGANSMTFRALATALGRTVHAIRVRYSILKLGRNADSVSEYKKRFKSWTNTEENTLLKEVMMTSPTTKNFERVAKLIGRTASATMQKYHIMMRKKKE